jgi:hypothetical protein
MEVALESMTQLKEWQGKKVLVDAQSKLVVFLQS